MSDNLVVSSAPYIAVAITFGAGALIVHLGWAEAGPLYQLAALVAYANSIINEAKVRRLRRALDRAERVLDRMNRTFR